MEYNLKKFKKILGDEYDKYRKSGSTQETLAKAIGISVPQLQRHLDPLDEIFPSFSTVAKYCKYFDCEVDHLFGMKATTHDMQFICDETGLSQNTINTIQLLPDDKRTLLESILNETDLLDQIYSYVTFDVKKENIPLPSETVTKEPLGNLKDVYIVAHRQNYIPVPMDISDTDADFIKDLVKQSKLNRIRDILEPIRKERKPTF